MSSFTDEEARVLENINVSVSVFSFIGSTFIVWAFWKLRDVRSFVFQLVRWVAFSDVGYSIGNFLGDAGGNSETHVGASPGLCTFQAVLISYFGLASMLWSAAIAFTLHKAFLNEDEGFRSPSVNEKWKYYHLVCFGWPLVVTLLPFTTDGYGDTGGWCWIKTDNSIDRAWRYIQLYLPLWFIIVYNMYVYVSVYQKMSALSNSAGTNMSREAARVRFYPLVLVICMFWATINTLYKTFNNGDGLLWMNALAIFFASSIGWVNALVYGLTPIIREELAVYCGCKEEDEDEISITAVSQDKEGSEGRTGATVNVRQESEEGLAVGMENEGQHCDCLAPFCFCISPVFFFWRWRLCQLFSPLLFSFYRTILQQNFVHPFSSYQTLAIAPPLLWDIPLLSPLDSIEICCSTFIFVNRER